MLRGTRLLAGCIAFMLPACGLFPREHAYYRRQRDTPSTRVQAAEETPPRTEGGGGGEGQGFARPPGLAGVLPHGIVEAARNAGRWRALLVGISDYSPSDGYAGDLKTPVNDITRLSDLLENRYGFEVRRLPDRRASRRGILRALRRLHRTSHPEDNVLIYFAGHGVLREDGDGIWVAADTQSEEDGVANADIKQRIASLPARRVLLVSDSCFAGAFLRTRGIPEKQEMVDDRKRARVVSMSLVSNLNPSREVITSGNMSAVADEGIGYCQGLSPFACLLATALEEVPVGAAVGTTDLFVEVYYNLQRQSSGSALQRPQRGTLDGHAGGEFYFIRER